MNLFILNFDSKSFEPCKHNISLIQHAVRSTDCYVRYVSYVSKTTLLNILKMKLSSTLKLHIGLSTKETLFITIYVINLLNILPVILIV